MQPLVPGFIITGELDSNPSGPTWAAVRSRDDQPFVLKVIQGADPGRAKALVARHAEILDTVQSEHVVRCHAAIDLADGALALVCDQVSGGSLAHLLGARGQLTPGEAVTTVAPLFRALADLHARGVVHGELTPANVLFSPDGRPLISDLGVAGLLPSPAVPSEGAWAGGFVAPELVGGSPVSPASDVYAMAALGWFCLAGAPPAPAATRPSLAAIRPDVPPRLVAALTSCLATNPAARLSADEAAVTVLEAAPAESVALASASDPAAEITRRIRSDAQPALAVPLPTTRATRRAGKTGRAQTLTKGRQDPLVIGAVVLAALAIGVAAIWVVRSPSATTAVRAPSSATPAPSSAAPAVASTATRDVLSAADSPRLAPAGLLQGLVDARALAYVARSPGLLDLVYVPGAARAAVDRGNIATAVKNGGTYLGLTYAVRDVAYLGGGADTARIQATIVTPAYQTGQPDGRKISHAQDILRSCVFTLSLTRDGWRILSLTAPTLTG